MTEEEYWDARRELAAYYEQCEQQEKDGAIMFEVVFTVNGVEAAKNVRMAKSISDVMKATVAGDTTLLTVRLA